MSSSRPAVFLDRDGTLNREVDYLRDPDQLELLRGVPAALGQLAEQGYALIVVTNQSGIARGYFSEADLARIHARLRDLLVEHGVRLDHVAYCPHHPTVGLPGYLRACECRKPAPGMLLDSARRLGLDLARSWMIGDSARDLEAGEAAGTRSVLVRTGKGRAELESMKTAGRGPEHVADDLAGAAALILPAAR